MAQRVPRQHSPHSSPPTDLELQRARFEQLIVPEIPFLTRAARAMSRSTVQAEDLTQETLAKAFGAIDRFDGHYPRAWLARIARNTAINRDRRRSDALLPQGTVSEATASDGGAEDPQTLVVDRNPDTVLLKALEALPPSFRIVVQLVDVEARTYQETADTLRLPVGTVMSRLHRARRRLRAALTDTHLPRSTGVPARRAGG